jgi:hypothetical protein
MASALAAFVAVRLAANVVAPITPRERNARESSAPVGHPLGIHAGVHGREPTIANAWVISSRLVDTTGRPPTLQALNQFVERACPTIVNPNTTAPTGMFRS